MGRVRGLFVSCVEYRIVFYSRSPGSATELMIRVLEL